jgi:diacylglycerol kinase family enzyme
VRINDRSFFGVAGIGFDAEIGWRFAQAGRRGFASYIQTILQTFPKYRPATYQVVIDGVKSEETAFLISFANSPEFGNGAKIAPGADMRDGFFNIVIIRPFPFYQAPLLAFQLFCGRIDRLPFVCTCQAKVAAILQPNLQMHIDGEPVLFPDGAYLSIQPSSLQVIVP